ncbi:MAG: bifunctional serine/threonine-protein kinase/formylglycine-generating enzyme family protein [Proteobacteria bacterium]|nr:bifunctional serine/threonine-protein kinase/formylglycine-generating enzyme family protein [Pseudomonadota bacterium]
MAELHLSVGLAALQRGYLTLEQYARGVNDLVAAGDLSVRDLWVRPGVLDDQQLSLVLEAVGALAGRDTMLYSVALDPKTPPQVSLTTAVVGRGAQAPTAPSMIPPMPVAPIRPPLGELIGHRYRKLHVLGVGGLGEVSACEDTVLGRIVALKAGHPNSDIEAYSSKVILAREARIISHLEHPNIIPIYDAGRDPVRGTFYVMQQVTENSFEAILRRRRLREGDPHAYTLNRLLRYFLQICNAVDYAHNRGVIHCDIKPANILLGDYGEVLLVDWGLAQSSAHGQGVRGGTLGYMAPEQMDLRIEQFDARTDVFALGAILYEILVGRSAFPEVRNSDVTSIGKDPFSMYQLPTPPTEVTTDPEVVAALRGMPEIEDYCMRALTIDRDARLASARELADAIEELIEGSKLKERKRSEADISADAGDELAERYHEFVDARSEKLAVVRTLRADVAPWAATYEKQDLWDSEDIIRVTDALQVRTFQSAVSAYERALDAVPTHSRARRGLARLYDSELRLARKRGDMLHEIANEQLLREVDDGEFERELQRAGTLTLVIDPQAIRVTLARLVESDRRLVEFGAEVIAGPTHDRALSSGRYVVSATFDDGHRPVVWPVRIEPGANSEVSITLPSRDLGPDEVVIPGGPARLGGDPFCSDGDEPFVVDVPAFVIQRYPVTVARWIEFLAAVRAEHPTHVARHEPWMGVGLPKPDAMPGPERLPVFGVSAESAEAFARWLSKRDGRAWRLPTEIEWEKAARGTDGRAFPWGDHFDATFCKMRDSRPGQPAAEAIGAFPWDVSPYGVCDLAGGVADWCTPDPRRMAPREPREIVSRGGSWRDWAIDCRLASRRRHLVDERSARVGFRLARAL